MDDAVKNEALLGWEFLSGGVFLRAFHHAESMQKECRIGILWLWVYKALDCVWVKRV